jgi:hypothetical protein
MQTQDWSRMTMEQKRETISAVSEKCNLPADRFQIQEEGRLALSPQPNDSYQAVDCVLRELRLIGPNVGFIGNELPANAQ